MNLNDQKDTDTLKKTSEQFDATIKLNSEQTIVANRKPDIKAIEKMLAESKEYQKTSKETQKEIKESRVKTYISYAGCDAIFFLDGKVFSEIQGYDYIYSYDTFDTTITINKNYPNQLSLDFVVFDKEIGFEKYDKVIILFSNEYGYHSFKEFTNLRPIFCKGNCNVDSISLTRSITYAFSTMTEMKALNSEEYEAYIKKNLPAYYKQLQLG